MALTFLIGFGLLSTAAVMLTWRDPLLWPVGGVLVVSYTLSNAAWYLERVAGMIDLHDRIVLFVIAEVLVASIAYTARMCGASRLLVIVVLAATVSVCGDLALAFIDSPTLEQRHAWNLLSNVCYAAECVFVISAGLLERARQSHRDSRPHHARWFVARDDYR